VSNQLYGSYYYGALYYGGTGVPVIGHYLHGTVNFAELTEKKYLSGDVILQAVGKKYLSGDVFFEKLSKKYLYGDVDLVYTKKGYIHGTVDLEALRRQFLLGRVNFIYGLLPYEVSEFQVIVNRQTVKFYWNDSVVSSTTKQYKLYDSLDDGKTWSLITTTSDTECGAGHCRSSLHGCRYIFYIVSFGLKIFVDRCSDI